MEAVAWIVLVGLGAAAASHVGTLPAGRFGSIGIVADTLLWIGLFVALASLYRTVARRHRADSWSLLRRLGVCLSLTLLSVHSLHLLLGTAWAFYVPLLAGGASMVLWTSILMTGESRWVTTVVRNDARVSVLAAFGTLLVASASLVSVSDLAFHVHSDHDFRQIHPRAWNGNVLLLFSGHMLLYALFGRVRTALLVVSPLYLLFTAATLTKIRYMQVGVQPLDFLRVPEFLPFFRSYVGSAAIVVTVLGMGIFTAAVVSLQRKRLPRISLLARTSIGVLSILVLTAFPAAAFAVARAGGSADGGGQSAFYRYARLLQKSFRIHARQFEDKTRENGILLSFIWEVPAAFVAPPADYSRSTVQLTAGKYWNQEPAPEPDGARGRINLIIYLVESLMDPDDLNVEYTSDPIPNLRALSRSHTAGYAIVPEPFGGSANTEFELLTGMVKAFLPKNSLPYRQYVRRSVPSLPQVLGERGYVTVAVQADPKGFFNRERVYDLLGFDRSIWLNGAAGIEPAVRGPWPADEALVEALIDVHRLGRPFFAFAFPASSHSPYHRGTYQASDLQVADSAAVDPAGELKEYVNALRDADRAIGYLIEYFGAQPDSTIIAILGDHLPPLSKSALRSFDERLAGMDSADRAKMTRRVPLVVWSNFGLPREETELSTHFLGSYLLEKMDVPRTTLFAANDALRYRIPIITGDFVQSADGSVWPAASVPPAERNLMDDYWLLQYDLLLGARHVLDGRASGRESVR